MASKSKGIRYFAGEKGRNRVRLMSDYRTGILMLEFKGTDGTKRRRSLKHRDLERGKRAAEALAVALRTEPTDRPTPAPVKFRTLFDNYLREVTPSKGVSKQQHDRRTLALFLECWGQEIAVTSFDRRRWDKFVADRRSGALGFGHGPSVGDRVLEYDLTLLRAVLNWASQVEGWESIAPIAQRAKGFPLPRETSPNRPTISDPECLLMRQGMKMLGEHPLLFFLIAHDTGHRSNSIRLLRWADFGLLPLPSLRFRKESDKIGMDHTVPISSKLAAHLESARDSVHASDSDWIFPSPTDPAKPIRRELVGDWWRRAEQAADVEHVRGRGWHSLRRKFATDLREAPLPDVCALGGWKDHNTYLKCYAKPTDDALRRIIEQRTGLERVNHNGDPQRRP